MIESEKDIRILFIDNSVSEIGSVVNNLEKEGVLFISQVVTTFDAFTEAVSFFKPSIIISEYELPDYNGVDALHSVIKNKTCTPFIFYTSLQSVEIAVRCIKDGAFDFIVKEEKSRLHWTVKEAIQQIHDAQVDSETSKCKIEGSEIYHELFELGMEAIFLIDNKTGELLEANCAATDMYGYSYEELLSMHNYELSAEPYETKQVTDETPMGNVTIPLRFHKDKNGDVFPVEITGRFFKIGIRPVHVAAIRNISNRIKIEDELHTINSALQRQLKFSETLLNSIPTPVFLKDTNGCYIGCNKAFTEISGKNIGDILGKTAFDIWPLENAELYAAKDKELLKTPKLQTYESTIIAATGEPVDVIFFKDVYYNEKEEIVGIIGSFTNVTPLKEAEALIKLRTQELSKINAEKDRLLSIIAHDLRNLINGVLGLSEVMTDESMNYSTERMRFFARSLRQSIVEIYKLLENLLEWSRLQRGSFCSHPKECVLRNHVQHNIDLTRLIASNKNIEVVNNVLPEHVAFVDPAIFNTIIRNLISNALKFTPESGKVDLKTEVVGNEKNIRVLVSDNGIGMTPDEIEKLFNDNLNVSKKGTKGEQGIGLGLILCKEYAERMGGEMQIISQKNVGTSFSFTVPKFENEGIQNSENEKFRSNI